jgi:hypothetical protein
MFKNLTRHDLKNITALEILLGVIMASTVVTLNGVSISESAYTNVTIAFVVMLSLPIHYALILVELKTDRSNSN